MSLPGIQFIGTQRSGSNLLRVIMEQSPGISAPHPPHFLVTFMPLMPLYEPLNEENYRLLISDMVDYVEVNPVPWENVSFNKEELFQKSSRYHLFEINRLIYEQAAICKHANYWCCKSMANLYYTDAMEAYGMNLKYIYLYRDGRDVALSFKKAIVGDKHIYNLAKQWKEEQDICLHLYHTYGKDRVFLLNYETLISEPETSVKTLCHFLQIEYRQEMLTFYESDSSRLAAASGDMWKNLEKPIIKDNTKKFLKELSEEEIAIFEAVAKDTLTALGYPLYQSLYSKDLLSPEAIAGYNEENKKLKKQFLENAPKSDIEKRQPQLDILNAIKSRKAK
ncbi:MAG: sulfotransferase [Agriterribacter sp.]